MQGRNKQIATYAVWCSLTAIALIDTSRYGLYEGCSFLERVTYPLLHANVFHAVGNLWCLHTLRKANFPASWYVLAYIIAVSYPFATDQHIVGLSGFLYVLMGALLWFTGMNKILYLTITAGSLLVGLFFPALAVGVHAYCFVLGVLWGLLNKPII